MGDTLCSFCRKSISGKYWKFSEKNVCLKCYQTLPKCQSCNIPCSKKDNRGETYCESCRKKLPLCSYCKKHILGQYIVVKGKNVCQACRKKFPACARCQSPMKEYLVVHDKKICLSCSTSLECCASCRIPLLDGYYYYPGDERKFCHTCQKKGLKCDICTLPLGTGYKSLPDKRKICSICLKTSVRTTEKAKEILQKLLPALSKNFSLKVRSSTQLHLVASSTIASLRSQYPNTIGSKDQRSLGIFVRKGNAFDVYIESFLPYSLCLSVLAHEYTHAWQADHFQPKASTLYVEGMAQWVSYHTLKFYGYEREASLIPIQQDIYGQGFRKIQEIEKRYGKNAVISKILELCAK
ncbi:MAG: hypothetical protein HUU50_20410 [Candidatus Brocadiae bacterium]|nr:hypothetical protein [Candidatus Brocadiia bacterium]